jgi:hypothetical protein
MPTADKTVDRVDTRRWLKGEGGPAAPYSLRRVGIIDIIEITDDFEKIDDLDNFEKPA